MCGRPHERRARDQEGEPAGGFPLIFLGHAATISPLAQEHPLDSRRAHDLDVLFSRARPECGSIRRSRDMVT